MSARDVVCPMCGHPNRGEPREQIRRCEACDWPLGSDGEPRAKVEPERGIDSPAGRAELQTPPSGLSAETGQDRTYEVAPGTELLKPVDPLERAIERLQAARREGRRAIAVLGQSGSGKSTFIGALARELTSGMLEAGHTGSGEDPEAVQLHRLMQCLDEGMFPPPTEKDDVFVFNLTLGNTRLALVDMAGEFWDALDASQAKVRAYQREGAERARKERLLELLKGCEGFIYLADAKRLGSSVSEGRARGLDNLIANFLEWAQNNGCGDRPFVLGLSHADKWCQASERAPVWRAGSPYLTVERERPNLYATIRTHSRWWKICWISVGTTTLREDPEGGSGDLGFDRHAAGYWGVRSAFEFVRGKPAWGTLGTNTLRWLTLARYWW